MEHTNEYRDQYQQDLERKKDKPLGFFKTMLASGLGMLCAFVVINILGFIMMIFMMIALATSSDSSMPVSRNTFLKIDLTKTIPERSLSELQTLSSASSSHTIGLVEMLQSIELAGSDDNIDGIYLYLGSITTQSWGQSEELRMALEQFKEYSGKPVIAYADSYNQSGYYIASVADRIYLHPAGQLDWRGIAAQPMFYKDLLDKFDIHVDLIRPSNNAYKSAGETYIMNHMSEANKEQVRAYITSIWRHITDNIGATRQISADTLNVLADNLACYNPSNAIRYGLIDTLAFEYDAKKQMKEQYGMEHVVEIDNYLPRQVKRNSHNQIAVVYAEGDVVPGTGNSFQTAVYGDDVAKAIDNAVEDKDVKAIILRVNSPGGAVTASEIMTAAVERAVRVKPVIVSMSDVAASAGYEISCNATKIVALPTTLTGSIGVFATVPEIGDMLRKHLGITTDTVKTNHNSEGLSGMRTMSPTTRLAMQQSIEDFYQTFIGRVAKGRGLTVEAVDNIARGRVWTGAEAVKIGLVDTLGGFNTAVSMACKAAGIDEDQYELRDFPAKKGLFEELFSTVSDEDARMQLFGHRTQVQELDDAIEELRYWSTMQYYQARMPFILNLK